MSKTAYVDTFAADNLPSPELWPDLINLDKLAYPERLNCARDLLDDAVSEGFGDKVALFAPSGNWTYRKLLEESSRIANVLTRSLGMRSGERVLLHGPNTPMLAAAWFGIIKAGGIVVATMPLLRSRELAVIIQKARVRFAVCDDGCTAELLEARATAPVLEHLAVYGAGELESLMARQPADFQTLDTHGEDVALIAFTSGTTGIPKGTMHFHRDVLAICDCFPPDVLKPEQDDVFAGSPPLAFTFGLGGILLFPLRVRASAVMLEKAPPAELAKACEQFGVTVVFTSPTGYRFMLDNLDRYELSQLRKCVSAGETLPKVTSDAWHAKTGIRIIDGIGSTEMLHIFISAGGQDIRPGSTGRPVMHYEAKIIDENGDEVGPGVAGRLAVRGPTGCRYLADDRQRDYVVDGWNLTGDAYLRDADGYYWFQARTDDMILSGGYNISAPEVEEAILSYPGVRECAVVASPDPMRGNLVKAFIVLRDEGPKPCLETISLIQNFVKEQIAPYKYPRAIEFVESLPKTENGKLQRFKLRQLEIRRHQPAGTE